MLSIQDILRPNIIDINGRRYRQLPLNRQSEEECDDHGEPVAAYIEEDSYYDEPETCSGQPAWDVQETSSGYSIIMHDVPMFYYRFFIGPGGSKRKEIERSSKAKITLPKIGEQGDVTITGKNRCGVIDARNQLQTIIELHRGEQPATHFFCIPLDADHLTSTFEGFQKDVLDLRARGVDASIFQHPKRLHLTLCLTPFINDAEVIEALPKIEDIVYDLKKKYFGEERSVKIILECLEYMNDDPSEVDVLYAKVRLPDNSNRLQKMINELVDAVSSSGYVKKQYDNVKLHATIMNTLFRENSRSIQDRNRTQRTKDRITFDAKKILELFGDMRFGEVLFQSIDISLKGSYDKDGRYKTIGSIPFDTQRE